MLGMPLPEGLKRSDAPWSLAELGGLAVCVGGAGVLGGVARKAVTELGGAVAESGDLDALVFDASELADAASLRGLYDFFSPKLKVLKRGGRIVVMVRRGVAKTSDAAAAQAALDGFVRSLAKELGKRGATANLIQVGEAAEERVAPMLAFLLSARSAFITAQPFSLSTSVRPARDVPRVRPLAGKTALVTGAARGIGAATARALSREGARVLCVDRRSEEQALGALVASLGEQNVPLFADVADAEAVGALASAVKASGGVDVVVHNAGVTRDKTLAKMSTEQWDAVLAVNLGAVSRLHLALGPVLHDEGRIVCLSSVAGIAGNVGQTAYAASKAGLLGWVASEGAKLAKRGIAVNAVAPGFIETRMTAAIPLVVREAARRLSALGQGGLPEDVAEAIVFLASPGAHGLCGRFVRVCGGAYVGA
jgi:3-oxoacyl-[acyl-carrier protein] reductase